MLFLVLAACTPDRPSSDNGQERYQVVCTTGIIADMARSVGGEDVEVVALMGPGVDPHLYKATGGDLARLRSADLVLCNGLHLEGRLSDLLDKLSTSQQVVKMSDAIPPTALLKSVEHPEVDDPHIWLDAGLWSLTATYVGEILAEVLPARAGSIRQRAQAVRDSLLALDAWASGRISEIPESQRILVTAHDAFGYFSRAYGIETRGLQGISTLSEFGVSDLTALVDLITVRNIRAVFAEHSVSDQSVRAVVEGCARRGHTVRLGGTLYSDALGGVGSGADTYEGMMQSNVNTIVNALFPDADD